MRNATRDSRLGAAIATFILLVVLRLGSNTARQCVFSSQAAIYCHWMVVMVSLASAGRLSP
jgi:hypothetical protein